MAACELQCFNKTCGQKFTAENNNEESCQYHPGVPVFHDALKGWSCCSKRTTDFTEFLKIPGCSLGKHSNEKPQEELKPKVKTSKDPKDFSSPAKEVIMPTPKRIIEEVEERPSADEPLQKLLVKVTSSYDKVKATQACEAENDATVKVGTKCRNSGCDEVYANGPSDERTCVHHPGTAVFHEGMKYWSCCQRKTSDFTAFLNQEGCSRGKHIWKKPLESKVVCRYDWHQTGPNIVVSMFAKHCNVETSIFEANQVYLKTDLYFEGNKHFNLCLNLYGVVDPLQSKVTVSGSKVEILLRKGSAMQWKKLGDVDEKGNTEEIVEANKTEEAKKDESDESDLDGIDDVIFD